ncbi:MAG: PDZ domain-containing protein [Clostridiales bacterium]|nr:PDZ domain-containing protein [Clostridiales bacterium]
MSYCKKVLKFLIIFVAIFAFSLPLSGAAAFAEENYLYLGGFPAGFVLNTTSVEVIGICDVITENGVLSPAREAGIKTGDIIDKINGEEVNASSDINVILSKDFKKYEIEVLRGGETKKLEINPAKEMTSGGKRLGVLVKDSINGIGTVTYVDGRNKKFASLGHPVNDTNNKLIEINGGTVYGSLIYDVKKGVRGTPGELRGAFENGVLIGKAKVNCACGVYGDMDPNFDYSNLLKVSKASINEVEIGTAYIYTTVYGTESEKYKISIVKVDKNNKDNRNFVIKIDDERLIDKTGGIVQGMSGSPIVQNGKLIGAVTHVMVNDPTRGYGIGIEHMLNAY